MKHSNISKMLASIPELSERSIARRMALNNHRATIKSIFEPIISDRFIDDVSGELWLNWFRNSLIRYLRDDYRMQKGGYTKTFSPLLMYIAADVEKLMDELLDEDI